MSDSTNAITELSAYLVIFAENGVRVSHCHQGCLRMNSASISIEGWYRVGITGSEWSTGDGDAAPVAADARRASPTN